MTTMICYKQCSKKTKNNNKTWQQNTHTLTKQPKYSTHQNALPDGSEYLLQHVLIKVLATVNLGDIVLKLLWGEKKQREVDHYSHPHKNNRRSQLVFSLIHTLHWKGHVSKYKDKECQFVIHKHMYIPDPLFPIVYSLPTLPYTHWQNLHLPLLGCIHMTLSDGDSVSDTWCPQTLTTVTCITAADALPSYWKYDIVPKALSHKGTIPRQTTYVHGHGDALFLDVMVVLVHVQHDDGVGQREGRVCVVERLSVALLHSTHRTESSYVISLKDRLAEFTTHHCKHVLSTASAGAV